MKVGLSGHFKLTITSENGDQQVHEFDNMILDSGIDMVMGNTSSTYLEFCRIGTGTTAPSSGQVALVTQAASTNTNPGTDTFTAVTGSSPRYNRFTVTRRFAAGSLNGNYTEFGFGPASNGNLFCRALTLVSGSPGAITVTSTDTLDVQYELRTYIPATDATGTVTIQGVSYAYTIRPVNINNTSPGFGDWYWGVATFGLLGNSGYAHSYTGGALTAQTASAPTGASIANSSSTTSTLPDPYVPGTGFRKIRYSAGLAELNVSGGSFTHLKIGTMGALWQMEFSPAIPKDATKTFSLDQTITMVRYP
jgi:hypothetical protein